MENALYLRTNIRIPMQIEALKLNLIKKIMEVDDPSSLAAIEAAISGFHRRDDEDVLRKLAKPMRKELDIEELKREQNWQPVNKEEFFKKIKELDVQEPLETLLEMI